jgi:uncharacterized protein (AIM24 family)
LTGVQRVNIVRHMKTTIDIADGLLNRAKELAARESTTLKSVTEEGLQMVLKARASRSSKRIKPVTVAGGGLQPEYADADWNKIRSAAYEGSGA